MGKVVSKIDNLVLQFKDLQFTENKHPNKMPFSGICLYAETPTAGCPYGADKPVAFSREAITKALESFVGMGVNCVYRDVYRPERALTGHDTSFKIGVVEQAFLNGNEVFIKGCLWKRDFQNVCEYIQNTKDALGFSIEVVATDVEDVDSFYLVKEFSFTGLAILYKNLAAFKDTQLAAALQKGQGDKSMNEQQFMEFMDSVKEFGKTISDNLAALGAKIDKLEAKEVKVDFAEVTSAIKDMSEKLGIKAAEKTPVPVPKAGDDGFKGKGDGKTKLSLAEQCKAIDEDVTIPDNLKARKKIEAFKASLK